MENHFTKTMAKKSDTDLEKIITQEESYQKEALLAAIAELEKRNLSNDKIVLQKEKILKPVLEEEEQSEIAEKRKSFIDTLTGLVPDKNYFITPLIIYLNIAIWVIMCLLGTNPIEPSVESMVMWGGNLRSLTLNNEPWRLLSNVFLHGGVFHLFLNMYALLYIGKEIETQFGNKRYLFTYIACGILASVASISYNTNIVSVGASGAIFGMYGLIIAMIISGKLTIPSETRNHFTYSIFSFVGYNLLFGLTKEGIDNAAHIGGLVSGLLIGGAYYLIPATTKSSKYITAALSIGIVALISILPNIVPNDLGRYQAMMQQFAKNEEKALWIHREDISYIPEDKADFYDNKIKTESIDIWEENIALLDSYDDVPSYLEEELNIFKEYSELRLESCQIIRRLLRNNNEEDLKQFENRNLEIEGLINELENRNSSI